jgi:DNA-binding CsgD family transcriptional regulator
MKPIFTKVEVEIIQLIKKHKTTNEIAEIRGKSVKSIEAHRKKMYEKAGVTSASEFSSFCTKEGIFFLGH